MTSIENRYRSFQEELLEEIRTQRLTLQHVHKLNEEIANKMEVISDTLKSAIIDMQENGFQLVSTMNPALETTENSIAEMMTVFRSTILAMKNAKPNLASIQITHIYKAKIDEMLYLINGNESQQNASRQAIITNNDKASELAEMHLDSVEKQTSEKCAILTTNSITNKVLEDLGMASQRNSDEHDEKVQSIETMVTAKERMSQELNKNLSACNQEMNFFSKISFSTYPNGKLVIHN